MRTHPSITLLLAALLCTAAAVTTGFDEDLLLSAEAPVLVQPPAVTTAVAAVRAAAAAAAGPYQIKLVPLKISAADTGAACATTCAAANPKYVSIMTDHSEDYTKFFSMCAWKAGPGNFAYGWGGYSSRDAGFICLLGSPDGNMLVPAAGTYCVCGTGCRNVNPKKQDACLENNYWGNAKTIQPWYNGTLAATSASCNTKICKKGCLCRVFVEAVTSNGTVVPHTGTGFTNPDDPNTCISPAYTGAGEPRMTAFMPQCRL